MANQFTFLFILFYPVFVYFGLKYFSIGTLALILAAVLGIRALQLRKSSSQFLKRSVFFIVSISAAANLIASVFRYEFLIRLYPAIMTLGFLLVFAASLYRGEPIVEMIAKQKNPNLPVSAKPYLRMWTWIWVVFFVLNLTISLFTTFWGTSKQWAIYNGSLSYVLMGILFMSEWLYRTTFLKQQGKAL